MLKFASIDKIVIYVYIFMYIYIARMMIIQNDIGSNVQVMFK